MNVWLILWIILSLLLVVFFIRSNITLLDKKKARKSFARKYQLKYYPNGFLKSPLVTKEFDGLTFRLFSEEQFTDDLAGRRFTTVFEWLMPAMPTKGIIASSNMKAIVDLAQVDEIIKNPPGEWDKKDYIKTDDITALMPYLTKDRMTRIREIIKIKNGRFLFAFDENQGVLRLETNDPLLNPAKISSIFKKLKNCVDTLKPNKDDFENSEKAKSEVEAKSQEVQKSSKKNETDRKDEDLKNTDEQADDTEMNEKKPD